MSARSTTAFPKNSPPHLHQNNDFPSTRWTRLLALKQAQGAQRCEFQECLANSYWRPLRDYLLARGLTPEDAADAVQGFISSALTGDFFSKAEPSKGKFRSYLLTSLWNHVLKERRYANAAKRMPPGGFVSLDEAAAPYLHEVGLINNITPEDEFHRRWLRAVLDQVLSRLRTESSLKKHESAYAIFMSWVVLPELYGQPAPPLLELARRHGLEPKAASNAIITMKRAFRRLLSQEIAAYALTEEDAEGDSSAVLKLLFLESKI